MGEQSYFMQLSCLSTIKAKSTFEIIKKITPSTHIYQQLLKEKLIRFQPGKCSTQWRKHKNNVTYKRTILIKSDSHTVLGKYTWQKVFFPLENKAVAKKNIALGSYYIEVKDKTSFKN